MSDTIFSLQLSTRIPTWAAAPTALQTHYQRGRQQDFVPGMRVSRSGLPRVFVRALACISMQMLGGRCSCTRSVRSTQPAAAQHSPRVRQPFDLSTSKCKRDALCNWGALPRPSLREMCGAVHDQTCRSARNRQNNNPRRYRGMRGTRGAARTRDLAAVSIPARVSSPVITRMFLHLFPLRLSAAAHIASRIYPRSRGELERQPFLFARWVLPDPTVVYHRRLHHTQRWMTARTPLLERFWFPKSLESWLRLFLVYCNTKDKPLQTSAFPIKLLAGVLFFFGSLLCGVL